MKNAVASSTILLCFLLIVQSCSKKSQDGFTAAAQPGELITATVNSGQTYTFMAGSGALTVSRQALHYEISETGTDERGSIVYNYSPKTGYLGSDEVVLMYSTAAASVPVQPAGGCPSHSDGMGGNSTITIKFNVIK